MPNLFWATILAVQTFRSNPKTRNIWNGYYPNPKVTEMKKLLNSTLATLTLGISVYVIAQQQPRSPTSYDGPFDETYWTGWNWDPYDYLHLSSTLGTLARRSDIIGVGMVSGLTNDHFTVTVDYALVGCTNGASIVVYEDPSTLRSHYPNKEKSDYMPTNDSRIVFSVYTNDYDTGRRMYWSLPTLDIPFPKQQVLTRYQLRYLNRAWWYVNRDDGVLFTQYTNVLQSVRFDRNWTNYFNLCRDGATSPSNRVREDSFWDMRDLALFATDERMQIILDDPLVDQKHKDCLLHPGWRAKILDE